MNDLLGAAAISGGASFLSGLGNYFAAKETNEMAREQFEKNLAFQKYQYEDTKRYNSFENQVRLARRANLNPSLLFGSGASPAGAQSVGGVGSTAQVTTPDYSFFPSAAGNLLSAFSQSSLNASQEDVNESVVNKNQAETQSINKDLLYKDQYWKSSNYLRNAQAWLFDKQADLQKLSYQYDLQSMGDRLFEQRWKSENQRAETEARLITNSFLPERCREEINQIITNQKVAIQQGVASLKSAAAAILSATNQQHAFDAQYGGDPKQREAFFNATMRSLEESIRLSHSKQYHNYFGGTPAYKTGHWFDFNGDMHRVGGYGNHYLRPQ